MLAMTVDATAMRYGASDRELSLRLTMLGKGTPLGVPCDRSIFGNLILGDAV
jgi:hypothetical protein